MKVGSARSQTMVLNSDMNFNGKGEEGMVYIYASLHCNSSIRHSASRTVRFSSQHDLRNSANVSLLCENLGLQSKLADCLAIFA